MIKFRYLIVLLNSLLLCALAHAQDTLRYHVSFAFDTVPRFLVKLDTKVKPNEYPELRMPVWSPGYYQLLNYGQYVDNVEAKDDKGATLKVERVDTSTWKIWTKGSSEVSLGYRVRMARQFVAENALDSAHAYIIPTATFAYTKEWLKRPSVVTVDKPHFWKDVATGLDRVTSVVGQAFEASDMDQLYDCPILIGNLTQLPSFEVAGISHYFYAYDVPEGDYQVFIDTLGRIVKAASDVIGEIPYRHYTFIGIGKGAGGIEHTNSTTVSFSNPLLTGRAGKRQFSFLAHEYFHHYNPKRIRPLELGPFDYGKPDRTKQLWISEGLTVYYEQFILYKAGVLDRAGVLSQWLAQINTYESKPGKAFQTLAQSSEHTWEDGPFGDQSGKTISYYEKGPIVGLLLDISIRKSTKGTKSLQDVMRYLYDTYAKKLDRGFTENEFWATCRHVAGTDLTDIKDYVYTTKPLDYDKYLGYLGLQLVKIDDENTFVMKPLSQIDSEQAKLLDVFFE
ncbi:M61 family metallopeptidase [Olivibacter sitiensis]|uniref:M61 family metallopeptidase n=1 Tax=Olivibacter sitiensis TaxID=376470 RepID=UPI00056BF7E4|nr:M61 family metallopeptidase [Olivibacter sitiensis]